MADHDDQNPVRLFLWFVPRAISTGLTKCLSAIDGMEVWFECFTYCNLTGTQYKLATGEDMPRDYEGNEEKVQQAATIFERIGGCKIEADRIVYSNVKKRMASSTSRYMLAKEAYFSFPDEKSWQYLPSGFKHVFLIRDPYRVLISYRKAIYDNLKSVGLLESDALNEMTFNLEKDDPFMKAWEFYSGMHAVWKYICANVDPNPFVINSDDLLANPAEVLSKLCQQTGLPYSESLLQWDASPDIIKTWKVPSDEVFERARAFYKTAVYSSGFLPPKPPLSRESLTADVKKLAEASMPFFQEMNKYKI